jgi:hypothetical protein
VTRWQGARPVRLRVRLTPRSPLADYTWRRSVETALGHALGPTEPVPWPSQAGSGADRGKLPAKPLRAALQRGARGVVPPNGSALAWDIRRPRLDIRVMTRPPPAEKRRPGPWTAPARPRSTDPPAVAPNLTSADQRPYD